MRIHTSLLFFALAVALSPWARAPEPGQAPLAAPVEEPEFRDGPALIMPCRLAVLGEVVNEQTHPATQAGLILIEYTIEVREIWIDPDSRTRPGGRLHVIVPTSAAPGSSASSKAVPNFQPLDWLVPYVFFLDGGPDNYRFRGGAQGVWQVRDDHVWTHISSQHQFPIRRYNGESLDIFSHRVKNLGAGVAPAAAPERPSPSVAKLREVIRPDYPTIPGLQERWLASDLLVRGRVVDQAVVLSEDGRMAWTDYSIQVLEVLKHTGPAPAAGGTVTARVEGGNRATPERVVSIVNELFPQLHWGSEHLFFLRQTPKSGSFSFLDGAASVFRRDEDGKMRCHLPKDNWDFLCRSRDGAKWEDLMREVKKNR